MGRWLLGFGLVLGIAAPGHSLVIDPTQSSVAAEVGGAEALSGTLDIALGQVPVTQNTTFDVLVLEAATSGGLAIRLDPASASPGAGVVSPAGSFLVPTLFLELEDGLGSFPLAISNVAGSVLFDASGLAIRHLTTSFQVDSGGPAGLLTVHVVAVPEPAAPWLAAAALAAFALVARPRRGRPGGAPRLRRGLLALGVLLPLSLLGANARCSRGPAPDLVQELLTLPGYVEPHTPGAGGPDEIPASAAVVDLLGPSPDLNRVSYVRTALDGPSRPPVRVVMILIPGFLGGGTTFDPLARDLVQRYGGALEVWAVDRRPNQLEDRLGAEFAVAGAEEPGCQQSPPSPDCSIFQGAQFYFPDANFEPLDDFPNEAGGDRDIDLDGIEDPQLPLEDGFGVVRGPVLMTQDDVRFMAHWGLDAYFRDWKLLVDQARERVGEQGLVLLGGHSQGTSWSSTFAAYDFDPDPAVTVPGHALIDGLVLLEGGGAGQGQSTPPTRAAYLQTIADLEMPGGPDVFLSDFSGLSLQSLATSGEVAAVAAFYQPFEPSLIQRTPTFGGFPLDIFLSAPATNRAIAGLFLDDDFSPNTAFRASMGFTDNGPNQFRAPVPGLINDDIYVARPEPSGGLRTWKDAGDPTLPTCPPNVFNVSPGCAILDNGPPSAPGDPPRKNGVEREVSPIDNFLQTQFGKANGFEWYFVSGRVFLDFGYGRDASALVAEFLALDPGDEGPLVVTQNASMDVPVIAIGGSNGLTPETKSFAGYLGSIATPAAWKEVHILEGYAHLDPITAADNEAVPLIEDFVNRVQQRKLLETF